MKQYFFKKNCLGYHPLSTTVSTTETTPQNNDHLLQLPYEILIKIFIYLSPHELFKTLASCKRLWNPRKQFVKNFIRKNPSYFNNHFLGDFFSIADFIALANSYNQRLKKLPSLFQSQEVNIIDGREDVKIFPSWSVILLATSLMAFSLFMLTTTLLSNISLSNTINAEAFALGLLLFTVSSIFYIYTLYDWFKFHTSNLNELTRDRADLQFFKNQIKIANNSFPDWLKESDPRLENLVHISQFIIGKVTDLSNLGNFTLQFKCIKQKNKEIILQKINYTKSGQQKDSGFFSKNYKKLAVLDDKVEKSFTDSLSIVIS